MKGLVVAGAQSGSGKTTVSLALMAALKRRGLEVRPFKVGPDFIDPGHHRLAAGRDSHNLDGWMLGQEESLAVFNRYATGGDVAVVEGVMGLYDGASPIDEEGSTAQMAKWLGLPVLLTVNARSQARSLAAVALGFRDFDPDIAWAGLLANMVGSERHRETLARALESAPSLPLAGGLIRRPELALPERHLGLITADEGGFSPELLDSLADWLEEGLDLDRLLAGLPEIETPPAQREAGPEAHDVRLGVARDAAFCFYYPENFRRLAQAGAELVFFSPLADAALPPELHGLYLGGGYPELFARELTANQALRKEIKEAGQGGMPMYAECGGMMYLGQSLRDPKGGDFAMAGHLDLRTRMLNRLRSFGYREVQFSADTPLGPAGTKARGHEFHYSRLSDEPAGGVSNAYQVRGLRGPEPGVQGFLAGNTLASYIHLHFGSNPALAPNLVRACRAYKERLHG